MTANPDAVGAVRSLLAPLADPARAARMAAYMKHVAPFLGIAAPARRAATRDWIAPRRCDPESLLDQADALGAQPEREFSYVGIDLLERHRRHLPADALPRLADLALVRPWWDTVDALAGVIGRCGLERPGWDEQVVGWAGDAHLWRRRIALVFQVGRRTQTQLDLLFAACDANLADQDFFMRKGIGWGLRDAARSYPDEVIGYVLSRRERLSGLSYREATKHLASRLAGA